MRLVHWDPFQDLFPRNRRLQPFVGAESAWTPAVDILEKGDDLVIRAEVPGIERDAIEVKLTAKLLEKLGTPFTVKQVAIYVKGIGLLSMEMETILPKRRIKMSRKLVTYTPNTK